MAQAVVLNRLCAPFSLASQLCKVEPGPTGSDYIGFARDAPNTFKFCTLPGDDPADVKPEDRLIKETWYLLADGREVKGESDQPKPTNILAIKKVVNRPMTLIYYLATDECATSQPELPDKSPA